MAFDVIIPQLEIHERAESASTRFRLIWRGHRRDLPIFLVTRRFASGVLASAAEGVGKMKPPGALGEGKSSIGLPPNRSSFVGRGVGGAGAGVDSTGEIAVPIML